MESLTAGPSLISTPTHLVPLQGMALTFLRLLTPQVLCALKQAIHLFSRSDFLYLLIVSFIHLLSLFHF
jgi:hypothetical protein